MGLLRLGLVLSSFTTIFAACGGDSSTASDAGADGSGKTDASAADGPGFADVATQDVPTSTCPTDPPLQQGATMCMSGPPECDYTIKTDGGPDIPVTCKCVPAGEDALAYQCSEPYSVCMNGTGVLDPSFKACTQDTDCTMERHITACDQSTLWVGVSKSSLLQVDACEVSWSAQYTPCSGTPTAKTEDGNSTTLVAPASSVHCTNQLCMTTTP